MKKEYTFQTLFELGQTVYYIDSDNVCQSITIEVISMHVHADGRKAIYYSGEGVYSLFESKIFESLEAVQQHVFGEIMKPSDEEL